jgi:DNA-binding IclR family transcriptional regulator
MVMYTVKEGHPVDRLFTREGTQLEAYCSAVGKVLLAHLSEDEREAYLATGPFVALTDATITSAPELRTHLAEVRAGGCAIDNREIAPDLVCVAVPVVWPDTSVRAAISLARMTLPKATTRFSQAELVALLNAASAQISLSAFGRLP